MSLTWQIGKMIGRAEFLALPTGNTSSHAQRHTLSSTSERDNVDMLHAFCPGTVVVIVLRVHDDDDDNEPVGKRRVPEVRAYVCTVASQTRLAASSSARVPRDQLCRNNHDTSEKDMMVIRFDASSYLALAGTMKHENAPSSRPNNTKEEILVLEQALGSSVHLERNFRVIGTDSDAHKKLLADRSNNLGSVVTELDRRENHIFGAGQCRILTPMRVENSEGGEPQKFVGYVAHLSYKTSCRDVPDIDKPVPNGIFPTPLLSVSLRRLKKCESRNRPSLRRNTREDYEEDANKARLQSCLKRQLVGRIVVINLSLIDNIPYSCSATNSCCNRSIVSLAVPDFSHNAATCDARVEYTVVRALPLRVGTDGLSKKGVNLFLIVPSTKITLLADDVECEDAATVQWNRHESPVKSAPESKESVDKTDLAPLRGNRHCREFAKPMQLLMETINAVRYCCCGDSAYRNDDPDEESATVKQATFDVPRAFLFTGPPGVGKTFAVESAVRNCNNGGKSKGFNQRISTGRSNDATHLVSIRGSELLSTGYTAADAALELERIFVSAATFASQGPENISVIFMDECDALLSSDVTGSMLGVMLDRMTWTHIRRTCNNGWHKILVVAATNRNDAVPTWLRRPGRLDRELCVLPPNTAERFVLLQSLLKPYYLASVASANKIVNNDLLFDESDEPRSDDDGKHNRTTPHLNPEDDDPVVPAYSDMVGLTLISEACTGYVAADLSALVRRAAMLGIETKSPVITVERLRLAMNDVGASALRDAALRASPATRWEDVAGDAGGAKTALRQAVEWPQTKKKEFALLGLVPPRGILLHGPPGCAKTTLARAAAGASGVAFLSLSPADVYASSYVGEAEAVVRRAFALARSATPCILFFDEIDSIIGTSNCGEHGLGRTTGQRGITTAEARVLSTFLNEMDGIDGFSDDGVLVLGATNRPSTIDAALLRPGRFDRVIYVPPPNEIGRRIILRSQIDIWKTDTVDEGCEPNIDTDLLARDVISGSMTGAEIVGACREAAMMAIREAMAADSDPDHDVTLDTRFPRVTQRHLAKALGQVRPLLSDSTSLDEYLKFAQGRNRL